MAEAAALPEYVQVAFGVRDEPVAVRLGGVRGWRCGDLLLRSVADAAAAAWAAGVLDGLSVEGLRLARPVRSSDGRWVVAGYSACRYLAGRPEPRYDDAVAASLRLHAAMVGVRRPRLLDEMDDLAARASTAAWGEQRIAMDPAAGGDLFDQYAPCRRPVAPPNQVVHGELFGTLLFAGGEAPAVLDLVPFWRPPLAWGGADAGLVSRWAHLEAWDQMLLRALLFRLALHAQHPAATEQSLLGLECAAGVVERWL
jgi:uncharacterized protein (TIGR02569 family)